MLSGTAYHNLRIFITDLDTSRSLVALELVKYNAGSSLYKNEHELDDSFHPSDLTESDLVICKLLIKQIAYEWSVACKYLASASVKPFLCIQK